MQVSKQTNKKTTLNASIYLGLKRPQEKTINYKRKISQLHKISDDNLRRD